MQIPWRSHDFDGASVGLPWDFPWEFHGTGTRMGLPYGASMILSWDLHAIIISPREFYWDGVPRESHGGIGTSIVLPWDFRGILMGL